MAKLCQALDALDCAKGINSGLDALANLMAAADEGSPKMKEVAEILGAMHDQMKGHLEEVRRCLDG